MIADLKSYPEYKESAAPWLGVIPTHWGNLRAKYVFREVDERSVTGKEELLSVSHLTGVTPRSQKTITMFLAKSNVGHKTCRPGDLAVNTLWAWMGALGVSRHAGIVSPAYGVYRPLADCAVLPSYVDLLLRTPAYATEYQRRSTGVNSSRLRLYPEQFLKIEVVVPPRNEQVAIVRFLDWANGRLERTIRAKRKVITLLNEQKQAIIHRAVTCGLDPSVPLKPSGVEWLGDVPEHWRVLSLKSVCEIQSGITLGKDYTGQTLREYPYLRVANVQAGYTNLAVVKTIRVTQAEALRCTLQQGDVLMTEGGDPDKLGRGCVWDAQVAPCLHQNHIFAVRPNQSHLASHFLSALMGTNYARAYFQSTAKQTTNLASTNKTKIGQFKVLLPEVDEQNRILAALSEETRPVNAAISRLEREIDLLREYRTRLVADVVTGKLDVREAVARLPDEAPPDIVEDDGDLGIDPEAADEEDVA